MRPAATPQANDDVAQLHAPCDNLINRCHLRFTPAANVQNGECVSCIDVHTTQQAGGGWRIAGGTTTSYLEDPEYLEYFARVEGAIRRRFCDDPEFAEVLEATAYQACCNGHRAPEHVFLCEGHASDKSGSAPSVDTGNNVKTAVDEFADFAGGTQADQVNEVNFEKRVSRKAGGRRKRR